MGRKGFDSAAFLSKVGAGKTIVDCQKDQVLFAQGDPANAVFYIQSGKGQDDRGIRAWQGSCGCAPGDR
jgi:hypothetical protein